MALEDHGIKDGPVLTGAAGGVGSVATAILAGLGHEVAAVTGRPETADYLKELGATQIVAREEITKQQSDHWKPGYGAECRRRGWRYAGSRLGQMKYGASFLCWLVGTSRNGYPVLASRREPLGY